MRPLRYRRTNVSFTIATGGVPTVSAAVKSRPCRRAMPRVSKYPGPTTFSAHDAENADLAGSPAIVRRAPDVRPCLMLSGMPKANAARSTPGSASTRSTACCRKATRVSGV